MGLSFSDPDKDQRPGRLRRVPDYHSRPVRLRLFVLVAAFILVLIVAEKARDPKSWQWFFALNEQPAKIEKIDNRLPPRSGATEHDVIVVSSAEKPPGKEKRVRDENRSAKGPAADPLARAWREGIKALWNPLDSDRRTLLFRLLQSAQAGELWPEGERAAAEELVAVLNQEWIEYQALAGESVADLEADEQAHWKDVLATLDRRYGEDVAEPLAWIAGGHVALPEQQETLGAFLQDLAALNLARVEDDHAFMVMDDNQIWHHLFWQLIRTTDKDLASRSKGEIPYAQLYRQPAQYRGQAVTVRGAVRRGYSVPASSNYLGIEKYYVYWIQPFESADTPLVVYALDVPKGFPTLKDRDDGEMTKLNEEVTVHGFLFKRGAYLGQQGTYNAPLILARAPAWQPAAFTMGGDAADPRVLWQAGIFALALAVAIAVVVYWTSFRRDRQPRPHDERQIVASLRSLQDDAGVMSPREALKQLEEQSQSAPPHSSGG